MSEKTPSPEQLKSPELPPLPPNILLIYSEEFRNALAEKIELYGRNPKVESLKHEALKLLDPGYVKLSIENLEPFPEEVFAQFDNVEDFKQYNNNFDCMFDGRAPRHLVNPAFIRLVYQDPQFVAELSRAVTHFRDFRRIRTPEAVPLASIREGLHGEKYYARTEKLDQKADELWENLPWEKLFEAYKRMTRLVDQRDVSDMGARIFMPVKDYVEKTMKDQKEFISKLLDPEEIKEARKIGTASGMFFA